MTDFSNDTIINKVAGSGLITLNLEDYYDKSERVLFDIKPLLFREMILKEQEFRTYIKEHNWSQYTGKNIAFTCSNDAIIPIWAYMLLGVAVQPYAKRYIFGDLAQLEQLLFSEALAQTDYTKYKDMRVIIKGCGDLKLSPAAYVELTSKLLPYAKSIMYGEACSNVPVYKKRS
ncbi:MAG: DUF2480 family protein [Bacteroidia bacterium]|nr:DUF2480 family protein [Bacteroidia bacterium]